MQTLLPRLLAIAIAAGALSATGCVARFHAGTAVTADPQLVAVSPGVWVVEDYDEPVFYSDNAYWLYRGGLWYRSDVYYGGWMRVNSVPVYVQRIHRPRTYVRYHGHAGVRRRPVVVRDHRRGAPPRQNRRVQSRPARRGPVIRDHRAPRREEQPPVRSHRKADHKRKVKVHERDHRRR